MDQDKRVEWLRRPDAAGGMTFCDLADYLVVSRQNLDGVLQRLEREQLVERVADRDDRRARRVRLTQAGQRRWRGLQDPIVEFYDQAAARIGFDERVTLAHCLNRLLGDLQTVEIDIVDEMRFEKRRGAPKRTDAGGR